MVSMRNNLALCGALAMSVSGVAVGAITTLVGGASAGGSVSSLVFPWSDQYSGGGYILSSYDGSAERSGASARSGVQTSSTYEPWYQGGWPPVYRSFSGSGSASAGVSGPNGASAAAGSSVDLSFDSDYIFGISFKTTGIGRITIVGPGNMTYADCTGNNEIIGFLPAGHYTLAARADAAATAPYAYGEYWPSVYPNSIGQQGSFAFTVPAPGGIAIAGLGLAWVSRRRRT